MPFERLKLMSRKYHKNTVYDKMQSVYNKA